MFQNISFAKSAKYYAPWAVDDVSPFDYSCADFTKFDYAMCNEFLGNWACLAQSDSARERDLDESSLDANRKALVRKTVPCQGLACSGTSVTVYVAQYDYRCGYAGGNQWL